MTSRGLEDHFCTFLLTREESVSMFQTTYGLNLGSPGVNACNRDVGVEKVDLRKMVRKILR